MKLIIATGISGCGRKEYLNYWEKYCQSRGKKVKVFHVGEMMFQHAKDIGLELNRENILNADPDIMHLLRSAVLKVLAERCRNADYDAVVICIHSFFYWNNVFMKGFDRFLNQFSADLFVTFIEDFRCVLDALNQRPQWQGQGLKEEQVLLWQNVEVEVTAILAQFADRPFFAFPSRSSPATFYKLVFHPEIEPVYVAMPISHLREPEQRTAIEEFVKKLDRYFTVFNPLSVEVVGAIIFDNPQKKETSQELNFTVHRHIVFRDQYWFVRQAKKIVVYWPKLNPPDLDALRPDSDLIKLWPKAIPSPGVDHETHEAFSKTKDVWVVFLGKEASPFVIYYATRMFFREEELFDFLDNKYPERKNLKW